MAARSGGESPLETDPNPPSEHVSGARVEWKTEHSEQKIG